jgi:hypothetical protein
VCVLRRAISASLCRPAWRSRPPLAQFDRGRTLAPPGVVPWRWLPCPPRHLLGHRASPHHVCPADPRACCRIRRRLAGRTRTQRHRRSTGPAAYRRTSRSHGAARLPSRRYRAHRDSKVVDRTSQAGDDRETSAPLTRSRKQRRWRRSAAARTAMVVG